MIAPNELLFVQMQRRSRAYCFTANVPDGEDPDILDENTKIDGASYQVWQYERAPTTGQIHIQGYVYFANPRYLQAVKTLIYDWCGIQAHLEVAMGTPEQNKEYCSKDESRLAGPYEVGSTRSFWDLVDNVVVISYDYPQFFCVNLVNRGYLL